MSHSIFAAAAMIALIATSTAFGQRTDLHETKVLKLDVGQDQRSSLAELITLANQHAKTTRRRFASNLPLDEVFLDLAADVSITPADLPRFLLANLCRLRLDYSETRKKEEILIQLRQPAKSYRGIPKRPKTRWVADLGETGPGEPGVVLTTIRLTTAAAVASARALRQLTRGRVQCAILRDRRTLVVQGPSDDLRAMLAVWQSSGTLLGSSTTTASQFASLIPPDAIAAAWFTLPSKHRPLRTLFESALSKSTRETLQKSDAVGNTEDRLQTLRTEIESAVGVILRANRRSPRSVQQFPTLSKRDSFQWCFLFPIHPDAQNSPRVQQLFQQISSNRRDLGIQSQFRLSLGTGSLAYEYGIAAVPGTGSLALGRFGNYLAISNSGPMLYSVARRQEKGTTSLKEWTHERNGTSHRWIRGEMRQHVGAELKAPALPLRTFEQWIQIAFRTWAKTKAP